MSLGAVIEVILRSTYLAQECLNVFHYMQTNETAGDVDLDDFADDFLTAWLPALEAVQSTGLTYFEIDVTGIVDHTGVLVRAVEGEAGGVSGDGMPPFVAWSWMLRRSTTLTFNGHKRFAGVPESLQVNGEATGAAATDLAAVTDLMPYVFNIDAWEMAPIILSKVLNGVERDPWVTNIVQEGVFKGISSQNTRKFGRGV